MSTDTAPTPTAETSGPSRTIWGGALAAIGAVLAGALGWYSGVSARLDEHTQAIDRVEIRLDHVDSQLDRLENKIDRIPREEKP